MSTGIGVVDNILFLSTYGQLGSIGGQKGWLAGGLSPNPQKISGPRLDDLSVQSSTYGKPIPLIFGPKNRASGNLIWSTGLIEKKKKTEQDGGGKGGGGSSTTTTTFSYSVSCAIAVSGRPINAIKRIWANGKVMFDFESTQFNQTTIDGGGILYSKKAKKATVVKSLRVYPGNFTQEPDSIIEAADGVGNVPAYRGTAYVVFESLQLADYGNQIPNITFEIEADTAITTGQIVREIAEKANVTAISTFLSDPVLGFAIADDSSCVDAIEPLQTVYDFNLVEQYGQVRAVKRARGISATIPLSDMGASPSDGATDYFTFTKASQTDLPRVVTVSYPDPTYDFQTVSQTAYRIERDSQNIIDIEVPIVITAQEAKRIADKTLWTAWAESDNVKFSLTDKWSRLTTGEIVAVPIAGEYQPMRILEITRGENGVIEVTAAREDAEAFTTTNTAATFPNTTINNILNEYGDTYLVMLDMPLLTDDDRGLGYYLAATSPGLWRGGIVYRSTNGGERYREIKTMPDRAIIGTVATATPGNQCSVFDYTTKIRVSLVYQLDELSTVTELDVFDGDNTFWLGNKNGNDGEILQFTKAVMISPGVYDLTGLLRGRLGTEYAVYNHGPDEVFVLLDRGDLRRVGGRVSDWGEEYLYKGVSIGQEIDDVDPQTFINNGESRTPRAGVHPRGTRDGADLTITWTARTRFPITGLANNVPVDEWRERYEVDIMNGTTVVRTFVVDDPLVLYTSAMQVADFGSNQAIVNCNIYQLNETRGRGRVLEASV